MVRHATLAALSLTVFCTLTWCTVVHADTQVAVKAVERMPPVPEPLAVRDWRVVSSNYYSKIMDPSAEGGGFPAIQIDVANRLFRMKSYLGNTPYQQESMTCLGAVIGSKLTGLNPRLWKGADLAEACKSWFDPELGFYRHEPGQRDRIVHADIYGYWPAVQGMLLSDLWPDDAEFARQRDRAIATFDAIARFCGCPDQPNFDVLGWDFQRSCSDGRPEPMNRLSHAPTVAWALMVGSTLHRDSSQAERARAALAWQFGQCRGRYEMTFLPVVVTSARLNRLPGGIQHPLDLDAALRVFFGEYPADITTWCITSGTRCEGITCDGLDGARWGGGGFYAFTMGSLQGPAWLIPVVRYDPRYARAVAKYALHAANSARLLQGGGLTDAQQDHAAWKRRYDPDGLLFYEGLKSCSPDPEHRYSPYATGDPMLLGWGEGRKPISPEHYLERRDAGFASECGNIALYMGNQVGFLGGILKLTNVPGILAWDCLATDWFHEPAWPTTLVYNPYAEPRTVELPLDVGSLLYDASTGKRVSCERSSFHRIHLALQAQEARVLVSIPETAHVVQDRAGRYTADGRTFVF